MLELGDWGGGEELTAQLTHSYAVSFKPASHFLAALALLHLTPVTTVPGYLGRGFRRRRRQNFGIAKRSMPRYFDGFYICSVQRPTVSRGGR